MTDEIFSHVYESRNAGIHGSICGMRTHPRPGRPQGRRDGRAPPKRIWLSRWSDMYLRGSLWYQIVAKHAITTIIVQLFNLSPSKDQLASRSTRATRISPLDARTMDDE